MTTPARRAEAERVEAVYYWALNQLGNASALDALDLWGDVPATVQAARAAWWLERILQMLGGYRSEAEALAIAYYRLVRALRTGYTIGVGDDADGGEVSLEQLRDEFEAQVEFIAQETMDDSPQPNWGGRPRGVLRRRAEPGAR